MTDIDWDKIKEELVAQGVIVKRLLTENPGLPPITAIVMANDIMSAEGADRLLAEGMPFDRVRHTVGSYARLGWTVRQHEEGRISREDLLDEWPLLWRGTDPDDTDRRWFMLWREAWQRAGRTVLDEDVPLPRGNPRPDELRVYRGQMPGTPVGIAWSLDRDVAVRFATGAGFRTPMTGGVVLTGRVRRDRVMGYLTGRGESEVIVDPAEVRHLKETKP